MDADQVYKSRFMKADDLGGSMAVYTISDVVMEPFDNGQKPVVYFKEVEEGVVANRSNWAVLRQAFGNNTQDWRGNKVELFALMVSFHCRQVEGLRMRIPRRGGHPAPVVTTTARQLAAQADRGPQRNGWAPQSSPSRREAPPRRKDDNSDLDDDVPF